MVDILINDDYAVLSTDKYHFYYGYEFDSKECECGNTIEIWGFEVCVDGDRPVFRMSYEEMSKYKNCPDLWECDNCLLFGIGLFVNDKLPSLNKELNETKQKLTLANIQSIKYYNLYCEKLKENTILKENAEHNDKVVDKIKWENMILKGKHGQKN